MPASGRTQLIADIASYFADNTSGAITAELLRAFSTNIVDTLFWVEQRDVQLTCVGYTTDVAVANGVGYIVVGPHLATKRLYFAHARVITAGTTGVTTVQIQKITGGTTVAMLTTPITIDSGEVGSDTGAAQRVIDPGANSLVAVYDLLRIDVTTISTTPPKGLIVTLGFDY